MHATLQPPRDRILIQLTGDVRVRSPAGTDLTPRSRKGLAIIAHLALTPGFSAGRDRILGLLWGDRGEEQARASLRQTLVDLRVTAPDVAGMIVATRQAVALKDDCWRCDALEMDEAAEHGDIAGLLAKLQAARGDLLESLQGLTAQFDDWLLAERARRRSQLVPRALALTQAAAERAPDQARALATALLVFDPGNEDACRIGMRLDLKAGDLASLHRRYRVLEEQLEREFDTKPSPETVRLLRELSTTQPVRAAAQPTPAAGVGAPAAPTPVTAPLAPQEQLRSEPPLLLVSPLAVLDDSADARSLALILSEELETALGRQRELRVLSSRGPHSASADLLKPELGASYNLGGSARRGSAGTRVNIRLSELGTGRVVWSRQSELDMANLSEGLEDMLDRVIGAVLPAVERDIVSARGTSAAYAHYYGALRQLFAEQSFDGLAKAANLFESALETDPRNVSAMIRLSHLYNTDFWQTCAGHDPQPWRVRAMDRMREAIRIEPENARAVSQLGWCHLRGGHVDTAAEAFERAVELSPHNADMIQVSAMGMMLSGQLERADSLFARAFQLNPFPSADYFSDFAMLKLFQGEPDNALWHFGDQPPQSLIYKIARLAIQAAAGKTDVPSAQVDECRQMFAACWRGEAAPTDADMIEWELIWMGLPPGELHETMRGYFLSAIEHSKAS
jgi:DNA-binding SARP family transcriptional activator/TolB-like protein/Tfp pilus assembly protein PilF